ncbi:SIR2 family protein [Vibrio parahaemolyticus]|uniref:SIR2 family protein n=2 Tax=Vibrio parahaemolyticus TaxID=670 RepID=UPI0021D00D77
MTLKVSCKTTMYLKTFPNEALTRRLRKHKGGVTFVVGSAFTQEDNTGAGIPNVEGIIRFVEEYIGRDDPDDLDYLREKISDCAPQERYQAAFDVVSSTYGQNAVNEIIAEVINSNLDKDGIHKIPKAVTDFVKVVKNKGIKLTNLVTTNFDTLLEVELKNQGIDCNSYSLVNDTHFQTDVNDLINVFHLHGKWDQDTMHTVNQLQVIRERLEISLQNLVKDDLVVIMAYGGWEDSFKRSLAKVVTNPALDYEILWCFYESDEAKIQVSNSELIKELNDAITRARVHFYSGVDCNTIFEKLYDGTYLKKKEIFNMN